MSRSQIAVVIAVGIITYLGLTLLAAADEREQA